MIAWSTLLKVAKEALLALGPLLVFFLALNATMLRMPVSAVKNIARGMALTLIGLIMFLYGVQTGFMPVGRFVGEVIATHPWSWLLVPLGVIFGFVSVVAEPAVRVLSFKVEQATSGAIHGRVVLYALAGGVALLVGLAMIRVLFGFPLWYIIVPGYVLALTLMLFTDRRFVSIAFDSGAVATGPMTVTFLMALALGAAGSIEGRDPMADGFGLIALVALAPVLSVMAVGLLYRGKEESVHEPGPHT